MRPLERALLQRRTDYLEALDKLESLVEDEWDEAGPSVRVLRECLEIAQCLRRLIGNNDLTVTQIHKAFGAPGDFGYHTVLGAALADTYNTPH